MHGRSSVGIAGLLLVLSTNPAGAAGLDIQVLSADRVPIVSATISATCGAQKMEWHTNREGRAELREEHDCTVSITAPGFSTWRGSVEQLRASPIVVLDIAAISERIEVTASLPSPWAPLASAQITASDSALVGWSADLMLRLARARAGAALLADRIYVDGMPADRLPPASEIAAIRFNADPFSVLYSESDQNIVEVITAGPDRRLKWAASALPVSVGARNPLARRMRTEQRNAYFSVDGPVPWTPMAFSVAMSAATELDERPIVSEDTGDPSAAAADASRKALMASLVGQWGAKTRARASIQSTRGHNPLVGAGGTVRSDAGLANTTANDDVRLSVDAIIGAHAYRTGFTYSADESMLLAQSTTAGLTVLDVRTEGGAFFRSSRSERRRWTWSTNVAARSGTWLAGWGVGADAINEELQPNETGHVLFGAVDEYRSVLGGAVGGSSTRIVGTSVARQQSTTGTAFGERQWLTDRYGLRTGLRADYQTGDGLDLSPRFSALARSRRVTGRLGVGAFRENWSNDVLALATRFSPNRAARQFVGSVGLLDGQWTMVDPKRVHTVLADDFVRPLNWMVRNSVELTTDPASLGLEYTWTQGLHRPGSRREPIEGGWRDLLESTRMRRRHQIHARAGYRHNTFAIVGSYEWVHSRDNSDGPFVFPERQHDLRAEWARTAGLSPHNWSVIADLPPFADVEAALVFSKRSSAPMNIRSGADMEGLHLYTDRSGLPRNAGNAPGYESLDAYAHRRLTIRAGRVAVPLDAALYAENILGARNISAIGTVMNSPLYGLPLTALPGRTIRMSVGVAR